MALDDTEGSEEFGTVYEYTLSGVVDRLEGLDLDHDPRPPPSTRSTAGRKRRAQEQELVCCESLSSAGARLRADGGLARPR